MRLKKGVLRSLASAGVVLGATEAMASPFRWPVDSVSRVTSYYDQGSVRDWQCGSNTYSGHRGTDIGAGRGTPVIAAAQGVVDHRADGFGDGCLGCTDGGGFGNHIELWHSDGTATIYGHMTAGTGLPAMGAAVQCSDRLGNSGSSGNVTGPHVHFEVRYGGRQGSFYSGNARDPFRGACSSNPRSDWSDQRAGDPARTCAGGGSMCTPCGSVLPGWTCNAGHTARLNCQSGCLVTETCAAGRCEAMPDGVPDVCVPSTLSGCVSCGSLGGGWWCNAANTARLGCISSCLRREDCAPGSCAPQPRGTDDFCVATPPPPPPPPPDASAIDVTHVTDVVTEDSARPLSDVAVPPRDASVSDVTVSPRDVVVSDVASPPRDASADVTVRVDVLDDVSADAESPPATLEGGCGCATQGSSRSPAGPLGVAAALVATARRRRRVALLALPIAMALSARVEAQVRPSQVWFDDGGSLFALTARVGASDVRRVQLPGRVERVVASERGAVAVALVCPSLDAESGHDSPPTDCALWRTDGVTRAQDSPAGVLTFDVAADGSLAYTTHAGALVVRAHGRSVTLAEHALWVRFDGAGRRVVFLDFTGVSGAFSPGGGQPTVTVLDLSTGVRATVFQGDGSAPLLSWDGARVAFLSTWEHAATVLTAPSVGGVATRLSALAPMVDGQRYAPVWRQDALSDPTGVIWYVSQYSGRRALHRLDLTGLGSVSHLPDVFAPQRVGATLYGVERGPNGPFVRALR